MQHQAHVGTNTFAVEWIAAQIMGYKPSRIKLLKEVCKRKSVFLKFDLGNISDDLGNG
jgi:hypothetical protein